MFPGVAETIVGSLVRYYGVGTVECLFNLFYLRRSVPGGGVFPYKSYIGICRPKVRFLHRFGLKTGIHFAHFGLELGTVFEGTKGTYERIYRFNSK